MSRCFLSLVIASARLSSVHGLTMGERCAQRSQGQCAGECRWHTGQCRQICYREDTAYTGGMPGFDVTYHGSQELCRLHCQNIAGCVHFTYYRQSKACHVHDGGSSRQAMQGAVSGEPDCQPVGDPSSGAITGGGGGATDSGESMPNDVGSVMQTGSAGAQSMFGGLFEQVAPLSGTKRRSTASSVPSWLPLVST